MERPNKKMERILSWEMTLDRKSIRGYGLIRSLRDGY